MNYRLLLLIILCVFPVSVYASEDILINCDKENTVYECKVSANVDYDVSAIEFHFTLPDYANVLSYEVDSRWEGLADDNWVSLYSAEDWIGEIPLLSLKIESNLEFKESDFTIHDLTIIDSNYKEHKIDKTEEKNVEKSIKINKKKLLIIIICVIIILVIIITLIKNRKGDSK